MYFHIINNVCTVCNNMRYCWTLINYKFIKRTTIMHLTDICFFLKFRCHV